MAASEQDWARASQALNTYADQTYGAGQSQINWDAAKKMFDQYAATGQGSVDDWIAQTFANRTQWLGGANAGAATTTPPAGTQATGPRWQKGGVDINKWNDPKHQTPKYQVLRIADEVPPAELRAQIRAGKGAQYDKIKALGFSFDSDDKVVRADLNKGKGIDIIHGKNDEYGWNLGNAAATTTTPTTNTTTRPTTGGTNPPLANRIDPAYLAPWTEAFQGVAPLPEFTHPEFQAPDANSVYADKGYQFRLDQGMQGLRQGAASMGQLRTGATLKGLIDYGQSAASQEYGNVFNRALTDYTTDRDTARDAYDSRAARNSADYSRALQDYQARYQIFRNNQNDPWAKLQDLARLGQNSAAQK